MNKTTAAILLMAALVPMAFALPVSENEFKSSDENSELIDSKTIEVTEDYEIREYPQSKWICTRLDNYDPSTDPMNGWQERYGGDIFAALSSSTFDEAPANKMFMKLFKYILGVNSEAEEIEMTRPATTKHTVDDETGMQTLEMCFWTGTPWVDKELPKPLSNEIYVQNRDKMIVYVRRFGGWAESEDDWNKELETLTANLKKSEKTDFNTKEYFTAGYNSPWSTINRRNEIWIEKLSEVTEDQEEEEEVPFQTVFKSQGYELRKYPALKWICTKVSSHDIKDDYLQGWQNRYDTPLEAIKDKNKMRRDHPTLKMYRHMAEYVNGQNEDGVKIKVPAPVVLKHNFIPDTSLENREACFWAGEEYLNKSPPRPSLPEIYVKNQKGFFVYVRQFGGYALSFDDWEKQHRILLSQLGRQGRQIHFDQKAFSSVAYDSALKTENRRNEVWIPILQDDINPDHLK